MPYDYDVFLSYKKRYPFGEWVHEHFLPFFEPFVESALNRQFRVFVDSYGIATGDAWPERLQRALGCSRCLVAIWSPLYFQSHWCRRELATMLYREQQLGFRSVENPIGLVLPVCVFDGEHFPQNAKNIQQVDFRRFFAVGDGFKKTEQYVEFQKRMQQVPCGSPANRGSHFFRPLVGLPGARAWQPAGERLPVPRTGVERWAK